MIILIIMAVSNFSFALLAGSGHSNWGMAGALGAVLLVVTLILYACYGWLERNDSARLS